MNYERYYDKRGNGAYVLHFPNTKGLSLDEIKNIFSAFGEVLSVEDRGQSHGLCFIRYQRLDDVKRCLDGLQSHEFIKILPHKNKMPVNTQQTRPYRQVQDRNDSSSSTPYSKNHFRTKNTENTRNKRYSHQIENNQSDCSEPILSSTRNENLFNDDTIENGNDSDTSLVTSRRSINQLLKLKMLRRTASCTSDSSGTVDEYAKAVEETIDRTENPALICKRQSVTEFSKRFSTLTSTVVPAQEVIVANIHPNFGVHYILHLFEKHNPLSVSHMMATSRTRIRYCHVYFETSAEAIAIEKEFDMYLLHGSNLIVLRPQMLKKEVFSA